MPEDEPYGDFIHRAAANVLARPVTVEDLKDNLSRTRLAQLPSDTRERLIAKYEGALSTLGG